MNEIIDFCKEVEIGTNDPLCIYEHACANNQLDVARSIIKIESDNPEFMRAVKENDNHGLIWATVNGYLEAVEFIMNLLQCEKGSFGETNIFYSFAAICEYRRLDIVEYFFNRLQDEIPGEFVDRAFCAACAGGGIEIIQYLLEKQKFTNKIWNRGFLCACSYNRLEMAKFILEFTNSNSNSKLVNTNLGVNTNSELVSTNSKIIIDLSLEDSRAIRHACDNGNLEMVKLILDYSNRELVNTNSKADITAKDNYGFRHACRYGYVEVAKFIMEKDSFFVKDMKAKDEYAFRYACENRHGEIINLFVPFNTKYEFYFCKENQYYMVKPLDCELNLPSVKFDGFQIYCKSEDYLEDCLKAYNLHFRRLRLKSAAH